MKKLLLVSMLMLIPAVCWAPPMEVCKSSGILDSDQSIRTTAGYLCGVTIDTNGSDNVTVALYPSSAKTAGSELFSMTVTGGDNRGGAVFPKPIAYSGLYMDITGTGGSAIIYYMAQ